ncbi:MFS transporter [Cellulomonas sp. PhB143]|uniref:MFS transporter n=1 Tax=Cellulomonas sp. PhB143 TaxID=2485186 RepID=UPI000F48D63C|nr:MFS transporter [Cellulomonas sp. PhB143]ROS76591.1 MFS transporter [Cellulomonas sp. PhB143]
MTEGTTSTTTDKPFGARFLTPLLLGSTLNPINSSMLATGLVGIGVDFHKGPGATSALVSVLYLCSAVAQPTMGKLATIFGPRRVFVSGIVILLVAGVVGAAAPAFWMLLVSRALIGIGTSAAYPTAMALVRRRADERGVGVPSRVLGNFSIAAQITSVVGLPLGGVLAGAFGWRALFLVNVPVALVTLAFTFAGVAKDGPLESGGHEGRRRTLRALDLPGIVAFAGAIVTLLLFLGDLGDPTWWLLAVAAVLGVLLVLRELRASSPLVDVRMLASNGPLVRTYLRQLFVGLGMYTCMYGVSQWMEEAAGLTASQVGLVLIPLSGVSIVVARVVSVRGVVRVPLVLTGVAVLAASALTLALDSGSSVWLMIAATCAIGLANGLGGFANQATLYANAAADQIAVASGLYRTAMYLGAIFSSSLIAVTFGDEATDAGLHELGWVLAGIGAALVVLTTTDRRIPRTTVR